MRVSRIVQNGSKALADANLLKVLQSEIRHELASPRFQDAETGSLGDFALDWDSQQCQDVVLRRSFESGEEVAVSALLDQTTFVEGGAFPRQALMKVCVKKPGLSSILQFDCQVSELGLHSPDFDIRTACHLHSSSSAKSSSYKGPSFRSLDPELQDALKEYLNSRGINENLTKFILHHLHKKEQNQYVNWLHKLKSMVGEKGET